MRTIVADVSGLGLLRGKDGSSQILDPDTYLEVDMRDVVITEGGQTAWVTYRDDSRTVEVSEHSTYEVEYTSADVERST